MAALIVFLPGLGGNEHTWAKVSDEIRKTPGGEFHVAELTYSTGIRSPSDLATSAGVVLAEIERKYTSYTSIYLVGYSFGGLIAREICRQLLESDSTKDSLLDSIRAVVTLGTPLEGAELWGLGKFSNFVLRHLPKLSPKIKQLADPKTNYEAYRTAINKRFEIQQQDPSRTVRRPKHIHLQLEDDGVIAPISDQYFTTDDRRGSIVRGKHVNFVKDSDAAAKMADAVVAEIRKQHNATNPSHDRPKVLQQSSRPQPSPDRLVLFACSRTKTSGGTMGHDQSVPAEWIQQEYLRTKILDKRAYVYHLIRDGKIADFQEKGGNRVHQRANQTLSFGPDLGGIAATGEKCEYLPAWQRYTGRSYVPIESGSWLHQFSDAKFSVLIMSGLYGLIDAREMIQDYDVHLSDTEIDSGQTVKSMWSQLYTETIKSYVENAFRGRRVHIFNLLCDRNYVSAIDWTALPKEKCSVFHLASPTVADVELLPAAGTVLNRFLRDSDKMEAIDRGVLYSLSGFDPPPLGLSTTQIIFDRRFGDSKPDVSDASGA